MTTIEISEVNFHTNYGAPPHLEWPRKWCALLGGPIPPYFDLEASLLPPTNDGNCTAMLM